MQFKNKAWLTLVIIELVSIIILAPANCRHDTAKEKTLPAARQKSGPATKEKADNPSAANNDDESTCTKDDDCPADSNCIHGDCVLTHPSADDEDEIDAGEEQNATRSCDKVDDCGCGYDCVDKNCQKLDSYCCANADCPEGNFCVKDGDEPSGTCMPWQCDTADDCSSCGAGCTKQHQCDQTFCCTNTQCGAGEKCKLFYGFTEGLCVKPECTSDADCGCGNVCSATGYYCTSFSPDRPIQCCGTDIYHNGHCWGHEYIEDGNCLDDSNCPAGKTCSNDGICLPTICKKNSDCGCGATCWQGHCETGCNSNSDCCDKSNTCHGGECVDPNANDE